MTESRWALTCAIAVSSAVVGCDGRITTSSIDGASATDSGSSTTQDASSPAADASVMDATVSANIDGAVGTADARVSGDAAEAGGGADAYVPPASDGGPSTASSRLSARPLGGSDAPAGYWEYLPPGYESAAAVPLIVALHVVGANGNGTSDLGIVATDGIPKLMRDDQWPDTRPFAVLAPQYSGIGGEIVPGQQCPSAAWVDAFMSWALAHYKVDPARIFLTGTSCGAIGGWDYLAEHAGERVSAAVLIAGNPGDPTVPTSVWARQGCALANAVSIWALHGDLDDVVPYGPDKATVDRLLACPSPPRRAVVFSTYVGQSHNVWNPTFDLTSGFGDPFAWLLLHPKGEP